MLRLLIEILNITRQEKLEKYNLLICDTQHKLSPTISKSEIAHKPYTKPQKYQLLVFLPLQCGKSSNSWTAKVFYYLNGPPTLHTHTHHVQTLRAHYFPISHVHCIFFLTNDSTCASLRVDKWYNFSRALHIFLLYLSASSSSFLFGRDARYDKQCGTHFVFATKTMTTKSLYIQWRSKFTCSFV